MMATTMRGCQHLHFPDRIALLDCIKSCGKEKNFRMARRIHSDIIERDLIAKDIYVATALITMYARCGAIEKAREVFDQIPVRNVVSWNALISAYARNGFGHEALNCFVSMQNVGICPNPVSYACVLKACGILGSLKIGEDIDGEVRKQGLLQNDVVLTTALMDMYAKCGALEKARDVFEQLPVQSVVSWNSLITGYAHHGLCNEALECFKQMKDAGVCPDVVTYVCVLKACGFVGSIEFGEDIYVEVRKQGLLEKSVTLCNALMDMYFKCGVLEKAREVFKQFSVPDVVSWNILIGGYAQHGLSEEAINCFRWMQDAGVCPNVVTYVGVIKACGIVGSLEIGEDIYAEVRNRGLLHKDIILDNALVDMYAKCGALAKARHVFEQLPEKNVVTWSALIGGYAHHGHGDEALKLFRQMRDVGVCPNSVTYVSILKACGIVGSLEIGEGIEEEVRNQGLLEKEAVLGNALMDMYSKCGALEKARKVFEQLPVKSVVSWSALIEGYAQLGEANMALNMYERMKAENFVPNLVTFTVLLTACSHAGLVEEGQKLFDEMRIDYHLTPTLEHYSCMIDLFGRAGHFDKAKSFLNKVSHLDDDLPLLLTLMGACRKWRNVKLGNWAFEQLVRLDETCSAAYVCMENIYASAGMQVEAREIEFLRAKNKAWNTE